MAGWILAIDVGTTSTAAARRVGERIEMIQLQGGPRMPSLVFWREGTGGASTGRLVLGNEAEELSPLAPWCLERTPKSRLGEEFIQLGDKQLRPVEIIAAILREVQNEALSLSGGEAPAEVRLTHPARWRRYRLEELKRAAELAGISDPILVPEPVAAAVHFASERLGAGERVAVYDLGGGTLDTAVLKRGKGTFEVIGRTGGDEELGGEDFDDLLYRHLLGQIDDETAERLRTAEERRDRTWAQANRELLRHARRAKEGLSRNDQYEFYMPPPIDREMKVELEDFERLIEPTLKGTIAELERTIRAARIEPTDLAAIYLAGGSSRIPLVARLIRERLGITPEHLDDPKAVIALGAARLNESAARNSVIEGAPLPADSAPIPPLPSGADATELELGAASAAAAGRDPDATDLEPAGTPATRGDPGATELEPAGPTPVTDGKSPGDGGGRRKVGLGVLAVIVVGGIAAGVVALIGGGSSTVTLTSTSTSTVAAPTTSSTTTTTSPVNNGNGSNGNGGASGNGGANQGATDLLLSAVQQNLRKSCTKEPSKYYGHGAQFGLICKGGANGAAVILELYSSPSGAAQAFDKLAASSTGGVCGDTWNIRSNWTNRAGEPRGLLSCYDSRQGQGLVIWTDRSRRTLGYVFGKHLSHSELYGAWRHAANETPN